MFFNGKYIILNRRNHPRRFPRGCSRCGGIGILILMHKDNHDIFKEIMCPRCKGKCFKVVDPEISGFKIYFRAHPGELIRGYADRGCKRIFSDTIKGEFNAKMEVHSDGSAMGRKRWRKDQAWGGSVLSSDEKR